MQTVKISAKPVVKATKVTFADCVVEKKGEDGKWAEVGTLVAGDVPAEYAGTGHRLVIRGTVQVPQPKDCGIEITQLSEAHATLLASVFKGNQDFVSERQGRTELRKALLSDPTKKSAGNQAYRLLKTQAEAGALSKKAVSALRETYPKEIARLEEEGLLKNANGK